MNHTLLRPVALACLLALAGGAQAALHARNLVGDAAPEAYYDDLLNITWLANASAPGYLTWQAAKDWVSHFSIGGIGGWRLPKHVDTGRPGCDLSWIGGPGGTDCGLDVDVRTGELAHLYYVTLHNISYPKEGWLKINDGPFTNLNGRIEKGGAEYWWYGDHYLFGNNAWTFKPDFGAQVFTVTTLPSGVWAVRDGDVPQVPEPGTWALMALGLAGLGALRRRKA